MTTPQHSKTTQGMLMLTAIGIVFGDIGTSPLYALRECFHHGNQLAVTPDNVWGILSLIFWSLMIVISFKYLRFVMRADNKGEGGILALTALACSPTAEPIKKGISKVILSIGLFGACLLIGDGMITPAISVLSAVEGLKVATPVFESWVMPISIIILVALFSIQKFGTHKIGSLFGPITLVWFITIGYLGLNQIMSAPHVLFAVSPHFALKFLIYNFELAFVVMGSVFLVVTGGEALYADMGHFGREAITRGWYFCALPALLLNYFGQGALLLERPEAIENPFYYLAPEWALLPLVVLATMAAIIASQAIISGLFSLARQCIQLGYSPRLKISYTSEHHSGQIYVPFMNWITMIGTLWLVIEFRTSSNLSSAYGIAISIDMMITTLLAAVVAVGIWRWSLQKVLWTVIPIGVIDVTFFGSALLKLQDGGWVPLFIAGVFYFLMTTWQKGRAILIERIRKRSYPFSELLKDIERNPPVRVPGVAVFMVGDAQTTPPALLHNLRHNKVLHQHVVFLTVIGSDVPHVKPEEQVTVEKLAFSFDRVIVKYGFSDTPDIPALLARCTEERLGFKFLKPTYFLGREILMSKPSKEMTGWRKKVFSFMAANALVAAHFFKLPQEDVIEVGMEMEF
jgi:KUP system potassium uptake protein